MGYSDNQFKPYVGDALRRIFRRLNRDYGGSPHGREFLDTVFNDRSVRLVQIPPRVHKRSNINAFYDPRTGNVATLNSATSKFYIHELRHRWQFTGPRQDIAMRAAYENFNNPRQCITHSVIEEGDAVTANSAFTNDCAHYTAVDFKKKFIGLIAKYGDDYSDYLFPYVRRAIREHAFPQQHWPSFDRRMGQGVPRAVPDDLHHIPIEDVEFVHLIIAQTCILPNDTNYMFDGLTPAQQWEQAIGVTRIIENHYGAFFRSIEQLRSTNLRLTYQPQPTAECA